VQRAQAVWQYGGQKEQQSAFVLYSTSVRAEEIPMDFCNLICTFIAQFGSSYGQKQQPIRHIAKPSRWLLFYDDPNSSDI
jgi:hypothetical protein